MFLLNRKGLAERDRIESVQAHMFTSGHSSIVSHNGEINYSSLPQLHIGTYITNSLLPVKTWTI